MKTDMKQEHISFLSYINILILAFLILIIVIFAVNYPNLNLIKYKPGPIPAEEKNYPKKEKLLWGAYVGDGTKNLANFEALVGKKTNLYADFESFEQKFPSHLKSLVGETGKTLIVFWEPNFGYDKIIDGNKDDYIKQFALDAKNYSYPVILVPFDEMNLNEEAWGYGQNNNSAEKFKLAWKHIHDLFKDASNVKFGLAYNFVSVPEVAGNMFSDYYPGNEYVDYVGVDGFTLSQSWLSFEQIFDPAIKELSAYNKPILIFSVAGEEDPKKAEWIKEGFGSQINNYNNLVGWVWFNQGGNPNWLVNSDSNSLQAFKSIIPN